MILPKEILETLINNTRLDKKRENLYGECPYCGGDEFGISLGENHLFRCFRGKQCGEVGNIFTLLVFLDKTELLKDREFYTETNVFQKIEKNELVSQVEEIENLEAVKLPIGWTRVEDNKYLESRGFTEVQFKKYEIGVTKILSKFKGYVIFAIRQDGYIVGYVSRNTVLSKLEIDLINKERKRNNKESHNKLPLILRYINSVDSDFSKILYGIDEYVEGVTDTIIVVEGLTDKINLEIIYPELFLSKEIIVCCTWGKKISDYQIKKAKSKTGIRNCILLYDPDAINDSKQYSFQLQYHFNVKVGYLEDKDPGDLSYSEFIHVLSNLQTPEQFWLTRLQKRQF